MATVDLFDDHTIGSVQFDGVTVAINVSVLPAELNDKEVLFKVILVHGITVMPPLELSSNASILSSNVSYFIDKILNFSVNSPTETFFKELNSSVRVSYFFDNEVCFVDNSLCLSNNSL